MKVSIPFREVTRGSDPMKAIQVSRTHSHPSHGGAVRADAGSASCPHLGWSQPHDHATSCETNANKAVLLISNLPSYIATSL